MSYNEEQDKEIRERLAEIRKEEMLEVTKQAIKESIQEAVEKFGWLSLKTFGVAIAGALGYFILKMNGWTH